MRIAATAATLLFALASCSTTESKQSPYQQPNELMSGEIAHRVEQIPFQHREELVQNLLWLAQTGEQTIPALLEGLRHENPKVRSSCCWVLGRMRDRRTIPNLQPLTRDPENSVRMEAARSLVLMGDLQQSPTLIEGLDSDRKEVRYMCHEALKSATGHDFGYDHLNRDQRDLQLAVLRWRQWWGEYSGDRYFAQSYERANDLNNVAAPAGETQKQPVQQGEQPSPQVEPQPPVEPAAAAPEAQEPPASAPVEQPVSPAQPLVPPVQPTTEPATESTTPASPPAPTKKKKESKVIELPIVELPSSGNQPAAPTSQPKPTPPKPGGNGTGGSGDPR